VPESCYTVNLGDGRIGRLQAYPIDEIFGRPEDEEGVRRSKDQTSAKIEGLPGAYSFRACMPGENYAVRTRLRWELGHRYFDNGRYQEDLLCKVRCARWAKQKDPRRRLGSS